MKQSLFDFFDVYGNGGTMSSCYKLKFIPLIAVICLLFIPIKGQTPENGGKVTDLIQELDETQEALKQISSEAKSVSAALIEALKDSDEGVRIAAAQALKEINRDRYVGSVCGMGIYIKDESEAITTFSQALKDSDKDVRRSAAQALGKIGTDAKSAIPALIDTLKDSDEYVRRSAAQALKQIGQ